MAADVYLMVLDEADGSGGGISFVPVELEGSNETVRWLPDEVDGLVPLELGGSNEAIWLLHDEVDG